MATTAPKMEKPIQMAATNGGQQESIQAKAEWRRKAAAKYAEMIEKDRAARRRKAMAKLDSLNEAHDRAHGQAKRRGKLLTDEELDVLNKRYEEVVDEISELELPELAGRARREKDAAKESEAEPLQAAR